MRPSSTYEPSNARPRKASNEQAPAVSSTPSTFFLARESDLNRQSTAPSLSQDPSPVRTLKETLEEASLEIK
ncbi:hypothetical protein H2198_009412, partial [Neophaeococcomyces mojaviensis]